MWNPRIRNRSHATTRTTDDLGSRPTRLYMGSPIGASNAFTQNVSW